MIKFMVRKAFRLNTSEPDIEFWFRKRKSFFNGPEHLSLKIQQDEFDNNVPYGNNTSKT